MFALAEAEGISTGAAADEIVAQRLSAAQRTGRTPDGSGPGVDGRACRAAAGCHRSTAAEIESYLADLGHEWLVVDDHHLEKEFAFKDFKEALAFTNRVGELAESVGHHPDIYLAWGKVRLTVWTHKIDGLNEADFVFAAKADREFGS